MHFASVERPVLQSAGTPGGSDARQGSWPGENELAVDERVSAGTSYGLLQACGVKSQRVAAGNGVGLAICWLIQSFIYIN